MNEDVLYFLLKKGIFQPVMLDFGGCKTTFSIFVVFGQKISILVGIIVVCQEIFLRN